MGAWELTVIVGPGQGARLDLDDGEFVIGRGASDAGRLGDDPELSRRHASLTVGNGRLVVKDLGSTNGTFVNDERIEAPTDVGIGDTIALGGSVLRIDGVPAPPLADHEATVVRRSPGRPPPAAASEQPQATLTAVSGPATGLVISLAGELIFGRTQEGDGSLNGDPELSRRHARIYPLEGRFIVEDLGSTHGTYVNGRRIPAPTVVESGDTVTLGSTALRLVGDAAPSGATESPPPGERTRAESKPGLLGSLAKISMHRPMRILAMVGVFFVIVSVFGAPVVGVLGDNDGGFDDPQSEAFVTTERLERASGEQPGAGLLVVLRTDQSVDSPAIQQRVTEIEGLIKGEQLISRTASFLSTNKSPQFVSPDGKATYIAGFFKDGDDVAIEEAALRLQEEIEQPPEVLVGGAILADAQLGEQVATDLGKAEGLAFPILFALSLIVFRGFVAALLPLFVGILTVMSTFFALRLINEVVELSPFAVNVVIGLGLGLAIDYTLFIVNRYREELYNLGVGLPPGQPPADPRFVDASGALDEAAARTEALHRGVERAGRTIIYSAATVAIAMATLTTFPQGFLYSMGIGGAVCAAIAVTVALVALPALLSALGPRIDKGAPKAWRRAALQTASQERSGAWYRLAQAIMRRPLPVALLSAAFLMLLALPALGIRFTGIDSSSVPKSLSSRQVADAFERDFSRAVAEITVLAEAPPGAKTQVEALATQLNALPGANPDQPPAVRSVDDELWQITITSGKRALDPATIDFVDRIRDHPSQIEVSVAGETADFVDRRSSIGSHLPLAAILLCLGTLTVLFLMTGSVVLPLKSLLMNLLSVGAAFGLLVVIFQNGNLEGLLAFESQNALELTQPVLLFAIAFGLSTDYAVFLLTRIKEARDAGASETDAVAIGLERTGRIVTQAALLFCVAIGAFATSSVIFIKQVGVGTALAVIIDATIIRAFLVPSLMAMLGSRNWWAPAPLRRLHDRIGLKEG